LVDSEAEMLRQLVYRRLKELGIDPRQASRNSGYAVSHDTLYCILREEHRGVLKPQSAEGIAKALRIPVAQVWASVGETEPDPWIWPERYNRLELWQREIVEQVAAGFLKANEHEGSATEEGPPGVPLGK
jgi:lambda repressor-like predicted transcriptional regulator